MPGERANGRDTTVTIRLVAERAGVSPMTVSRVVRGEATVRLATRERVQRVIDELAYVPSPGAVSLRSGRTKTIRLLVETSSRRFMANPFQDDVVAGAVDTAARLGHVVLIDVYRDQRAALKGSVPAFDPRRYDATIALNSETPPLILDALERTGRPAILFPNVFEPNDGVSCLMADFRAGGDELVSHLIALGHRRIGFLSDCESLVSTRERRNGYHDAQIRAGIMVEHGLEEYAGQYRKDGYQAAARLLERCPELTAIYCINDLTAFGAIDRLRESGRRVPGDVSVTGYDDIAMAAICTPPLTTARVPWYDLAALAVEQLVARLERNIQPEPRTLPVELIVRGSTGAARSSGGSA